MQNEMYVDIKKSTIALFLSEILYKAIRESDPSEELFNFLFHSIEWLDNTESGLSTFHIQFIAKLTRYLGFALDHYVADESMEKLQEFGKAGYGKVKKTDRKDRNDSLERLLLFYKEHIEGFGNLKSLPVLKEVFED